MEVKGLSMRASILCIIIGWVLMIAFVFSLIDGNNSLINDSPPPDQKPSFYITRTDTYRTIEGKEMWLMEYTIDGILQGTMFNSREAMTEYREYLETIGRVYQREGDE
jgi:hypothetical protein